MENQNKDSFANIDSGDFTVADYHVCFKKDYIFDLRKTLRTALDTNASKSEISYATTEHRWHEVATTAMQKAISQRPHASKP
jgi:hypothetical protein